MDNSRRKATGTTDAFPAERYGDCGLRRFHGGESFSGERPPTKNPANWRVGSYQTGAKMGLLSTARANATTDIQRVTRE